MLAENLGYLRQGSGFTFRFIGVEYPVVTGTRRGTLRFLFCYESAFSFLLCLVVFLFVVCFSSILLASFWLLFPVVFYSSGVRATFFVLGYNFCSTPRA